MTETDNNLTIEEKIKNASPRQLYSFCLAMFKKWVGGDRKGNKYFKLATAEAHRRMIDRYGEWEHAKVELDNTQIPRGYSKSTDLLPILGYPVYLGVSPKKITMTIINSELNTAYMRELGEVSYETAKNIFDN